MNVKTAMTIFAAFLTLTLVACNKNNQKSEAPGEISYSEKERALEKEAEAAIRKILKDPDSAQFKDFMCIDIVAESFECTVMVNAKNGFGGYVGFEKYYYNQPRRQAEKL
jgi:hypothetical protein